MPVRRLGGDVCGGGGVGGGGWRRLAAAAAVAAVAAAAVAAVAAVAAAVAVARWQWRWRWRWQWRRGLQAGENETSPCGGRMRRPHAAAACGREVVPVHTSNVVLAPARVPAVTGRNRAALRRSGEPLQALQARATARRPTRTSRRSIASVRSWLQRRSCGLNTTFTLGLPAARWSTRSCGLSAHSAWHAVCDRGSPRQPHGPMDPRGVARVGPAGAALL